MVRLKNILLYLLRWLFGAVFVFSGLTKAVDPVGASVFVEKYLATYGLDSLIGFALPIAICLATVELALGIMVVINAFHRVALRISLLFVAIFAIITLLSATILPIGDCGCFGDAVTLSPWATFWKNIALLVAVVVLIAFDKKQYSTSFSQIVVCSLGALFALGVNLYALRHQPLVDFMPYKVGVDLRTAIFEERARVADNLKLLFVDKTTGEEHLFASTDSECWLDENLEYVDVREMEVAEAEYADFAIYDAEGNDISTQLLEREGRVAWLCIASSDIDETQMRGINSLFAQYPSQAIVVLTSTDAVGEMFGEECYTVDAMTLRSMMRSEVGVIVVNSGVVELKADIRDI